MWYPISETKDAKKCNFQRSESPSIMYYLKNKVSFLFVHSLKKFVNIILSD